MNDEVDILKLGRLFRDMVETEGWREFEKILEFQIREREQLILAPFHTMNFPGLEGVAPEQKLIAMESLKGAIIGLRLAMSIPSNTITHAREIAREEENQDAA